MKITHLRQIRSVLVVQTNAHMDGTYRKNTTWRNTIVWVLLPSKIGKCIQHVKQVIPAPNCRNISVKWYRNMEYYFIRYSQSHMHAQTIFCTVFYHFAQRFREIGLSRHCPSESKDSDPKSFCDLRKVGWCPQFKSIVFRAQVPT